MLTILNGADSLLNRYIKDAAELAIQLRLKKIGSECLIFALKKNNPSIVFSTQLEFSLQEAFVAIKMFCKSDEKTGLSSWDINDSDFSDELKDILRISSVRNENHEVIIVTELVAKRVMAASYDSRKKFISLIIHLQKQGVKMLDQQGNLKEYEKAFDNIANSKNGNNTSSQEAYTEIKKNAFDYDAETKKHKKSPNRVSFEQLKGFGTELTAHGCHYEIFDRDAELDLMEVVLLRKNKNNPCLVGDAGVGKTAIVNGFAQRIMDGNVSKRLKDSQIFEINITSVLAGTKYRGEFEMRLNAIIKFGKDNPNVIFFMDEIHMLKQCGSTEENNTDAFNILKTAMASNSIRIIGATTVKEFRNSVESDEAFSRRVQKIDIPEPSLSVTKTIIEKLKPSYEAFHKVKLSPEALDAAIEMSDKFIKDKFFPDKAITIIDEAMATAYKNGKRVIRPENIATIIHNHTGIDVKQVTSSDMVLLSNLEDELHKGIVGQEEAVSAVSRAIRRNKIGLTAHNRPIGSFMFVGPTGVGKTELAKVLCNWMSGAKLIRFDMSEFKESHSIAKLIGSPPGYVGYANGGLLTEAIRRNPYSVVLFDEIEKAHPDISNILLQIMDEGYCTDSHGMKVDFRNSIVIVSSNLGTQAAKDIKLVGFNRTTIESKENDAVDAAVKEFFRPELINRFDATITFHKLSTEHIGLIAKNLLDALCTRVNLLGYNVSIDDSLVELVKEKGFDSNFGARSCKRVIQSLVEDYISDKIVSGEIVKGKECVLFGDGESISMKELEMA